MEEAAAHADDVAGEPGAAAEPAAPAAPDQDLVDDAYDDFLRRYQQESGEGPSPS